MHPLSYPTLTTSWICDTPDLLIWVRRKGDATLTRKSTARNVNDDHKNTTRFRIVRNDRWEEQMHISHAINQSTIVKINIHKGAFCNVHNLPTSIATYATFLFHSSSSNSTGSSLKTFIRQTSVQLPTVWSHKSIAFCQMKKKLRIMGA